MADEDVRGLDAGGVFLDIGARFHRHEFDQWDRRRAASEAAAKRKIEQELGAKVDDRAFKRYMAETEKVRRRDREMQAFKAVLGPDFDDRGFKAYERGANQTERTNVKLGRSMRDVDFGLVNIGSRIPLVKWGAFAAGAIGAAEALISFTSAAGPAVGILGAIPGAVSAAAQALGAGALGLVGIGDAVKQTAQAQDQASKTAVQTADRARSSARSIAAAERSVADAQREATKAQEDLTQARQDARRELEDLRLAASRADLGQRQAATQLREAIAELHRVQGDPEATRIDMQRAQQGVDAARLGVREAKVEARRANEDLAKGSDAVATAQDRVHEANRRVADATRQLNEAQTDAASSANKLASAQSNVEQAMAHLSPTARRFVGFLVGLRPELDRLRAASADNLLPGLEKGIRGAMRNLPVFRRLIGETAKELGDLGAAGGKQFGSPEWGRDLEEQGKRNVQTLDDVGRATLFVADALRHVSIAAGPLQDYLSRSTRLWAQNRAEQAEAGRESGRLERFFRHTITVLKLLSDIGENVGKTLLNIGRAANDAEGGGDNLLRTLRNLTRRMREFTGSAEGQREMRRIFERIRESTRALFREIGDVIRRYRELRREGKSVADALGIALGEAFGDATEFFVKNMAERAPDVARAFVEGFLASNAWGKLAITGWLISKLGGTRALTEVGRRVAGGLVGGVNSGLGGFIDKIGRVRGSSPATPVFVEDVTGGGGAAGGLGKAGRLAGLGRGALIGTGAGAFVVGALTVGTIATGMILNREDRRFIRDRTGSPSSQGPGAGEGRRPRGDITPGFIGDPRAEGDRLRDSVRAHRDWAAGIKRTVGDVTVTQKKWVADSRQAYEAAGDRLQDLRQRSAKETKQIKERFGKDTADARDALALHYRQTRDAAKRQMDRTGVVTKEGLAFIKRLFIKEQLLYGATRGEAEASFRQRDSDQSSHKPFSRDGGNAPGALQGKSFVTPGRGAGDKVPLHIAGRLAAFIEPGELVSVANRSATSALMAVNRRIPRRAGGGMVRVPGDPNDTGGRDLVNRAIAGTVGQWIRRYHANIGYAFDPGGGHQSPGHNVTGTATDVYPGPGGSWNMLERGLRQLVSRGLTVYYGTNGIGIPLANHGRGNHAHIEWGARGIPFRRPGIKPIDVTGFEGPHGDLVERGLNKVRRAANRRLGSIYDAMFTGAGGPGGPLAHGSGIVESMFARAARRFSRSRIATLALGEAGYAESGMQDLAGGDASSEGPLQLLASTAAGLGVNPHDEMAIAQLFFQRGFYGRGGANRLAATGLPAHLVAQSVQGSAYASGSNYAAQEGRARGWMRRFNLQQGGVLRLQNGGEIDLPSRLQVDDRVPGKETMYGSTLQGVVKTLTSRLGGAQSKIRTARGALTRLEDTIPRKERFFDQSEELIVLSPGDPGFNASIATQKTGSPEGSYIDEKAITRRSAELQELVDMQIKRQRFHDAIVRNIARIVRLYRGAQDAIRSLITKKMPKSKRKKYLAQIKAFDRAIRGRRNEIRGARGQRADAWLDLQDVRKELDTLRPGAERDVTGANENLGGGDSGAGSAQADARAAAALADLASVRTSLQAFAGSGDIGQGGRTALDAVLRPSGVAGPGYVVGPQGQLVPVVPEGAAPTPTALGGTGGVAPVGNTYIFQSVVPYTSDQAKMVAGMTTVGIEGQAPQVSSSIAVRI